MKQAKEGFNQAGRTDNFIRNTKVSLICQVINMVLGFVSRSFFISILGETYLGVNGIFSNILTILNFAELGFGTAIVYNLYKPLKEHDEVAVSALVNYYKKAYFVIGSVISVLGLALAPFLNYLISDQPDVKESIYVLYILYLSSTVISYFNAHKKSLLNADQRGHVTNIYHQVFHATQILFQILFLYFTRNYIAYLVIQILCNLLENILVARRADKMYPFLRENKGARLDKKVSTSIRKDVSALTIYMLNSTVMHGTDNVLIAGLETNGVQTVGKYANYTLISETLNTILGIITNALTPSIGNLNADEDVEKKENIFYTTMFVCAWSYGFACSGILSLSERFISVWLGAEYVLGMAVVFTIILQLYIRGVHYPAFSYRTTCGLFVQSKYVPVATSLLNIGLSIWLGKYWGIFGILLASSIARIVTTGISDPVLVYKHVFKKSAVSYYTHYFAYAGVVVLCYLVSSLLVKYLIPFEGWIGFVLALILYSVLFNALFALCTFRTKQFHYLKNVLKKYLTKIIRKVVHKS